MSEQKGNIEYRKLTDLKGLDNNPRKITKANFEKLVDSIKINGFWEHRPIALSDRTGELVILGGHQRLKAAKKLKLKEVPTILYSGLTEDQEKEIILRDNVNNGEWDFSILETDSFFEDVDFDFIGIDILEEKPKKGRKKKVDPESEDDPDPLVDTDFFKSMLNDTVYDSNNKLEIPNLLIEQQAGSLIVPFAPWGADSRMRKGVSTYHFYVDDYRFEAIFKDPIKVLTSGVRFLAEPNLSLYDTTPIALGLYQIYRKRWIARYFQECNIKVYADLNVSKKFAEYNRMGIPDGYNAFMTRGYSDRIEYLKIEHAIAKEISGKDIPNLIVYGGGDKVNDYCIKNSLVYVEQFINSK
jgi:hypothetical protein